MLGGGGDFFLGSQVRVLDIFFHHFIITCLVLRPQNRTFFTGGEANDTMSMHDAQLKLVKYSSGNEEEHAAQIPGAIDYWNTEIHYWDRCNKQAKMMASPHSFYREMDQLAVW
jgi:hypothetical protein